MPLDDKRLGAFAGSGQRGSDASWATTNDQHVDVSCDPCLPWRFFNDQAARVDCHIGRR